MGIEKYKAVFNGEVAPGIHIDEAKKHLAQLFKTDMTKIESLFSGKQFVLKENMSLEEAQRYRLGFEKTGARCMIVKTAIVQETLPRDSQPSQTSVTPTPQSLTPPPTVKAPPSERPIYEVRYKVVFKGDIIQGNDKAEVLVNLSRFYKMSIQKVSKLFTGNPVTIKGPTDFWSAAEHVKRFKECGALCHIELVEPTAKVVPVSKPKVEKKSESSVPVSTPDLTLIREKAFELYENLSKSYRYVQHEYKIEKKSKSYENQEGVLGCFILLVIGGIIALLIWTSMRWYMGLAFSIGIIALMTLFIKDWDLKYADVFLSRMEHLKRENPALFLVTLDRWVNDLDEKDRAKVHFKNVTKEAIENNTVLRAEIEQYSDIFGPLSFSNDNQGRKPGSQGNSPVFRTIFCPSCGSTNVTEGVSGFGWGRGIIASAFLGPLGGAIVGNSNVGKPLYICQTCRKKWKR